MLIVIFTGLNKLPYLLCDGWPCCKNSPRQAPYTLLVAKMFLAAFVSSLNMLRPCGLRKSSCRYIFVSEKVVSYFEVPLQFIYLLSLVATNDNSTP